MAFCKRRRHALLRSREAVLPSTLTQWKTTLLHNMGMSLRSFWSSIADENLCKEQQSKIKTVELQKRKKSAKNKRLNYQSINQSIKELVTWRTVSQSINQRLVSHVMSIETYRDKSSEQNAADSVSITKTTSTSSKFASLATFPKISLVVTQRHPIMSRKIVHVLRFDLDRTSWMMCRHSSVMRGVLLRRKKWQSDPETDGKLKT